MQTAYALDLSRPNVSEAWGYTRTLMYQPLSAAETATYAAQLEEGLIAEMPQGAAVRTNEGSWKVYSDIMAGGVCQMHGDSGVPYDPSAEATEPDEGSGTDVESGMSGEETPPDEVSTPDAGQTGGNGDFLEWLLGTGGATA